MLKQNRKAQLGIGMLVLMAVAVIVGLVMFQQVGTNVEQATRTNTGTIAVANRTITTPATGAIFELVGQELVGSAIVTNKSTGTTITANYSVAECVKASDGLKGICYTSTGNGITDHKIGAVVNVSYAYYPDGYIDDSGARSITGLIVLLAAIAIALVVLGGIKLGDW